MTAPVPVTPTEAREAAKRALAEVLDYAAIVRQDAPSMKALDLLDALDRFVTALPAEPAADARLAAAREEGRQEFLTRWGPDAESYAAMTARLAACEDHVTKDWVGLREILDEVYPSDVFTGLSGDPGPTIVVLTRRLAQVEALHRRRPWQPMDDLVTHGQTEFPDRCDHCCRTWPCETVRALSGAAPAACTPYCDGPCSDPCAALSPAQPDPATVERARAAGREQGLREAEQAVRDAWVYGHPVLVRAYRDGAVAAVRALSSATPSAPEGTPDA